MYDLAVLPYDVLTVRSNKAIKDKVDWALRALRVGRSWKECRGQGVKVAVLDTGYSRHHPDLQRAVHKYKDFTGDGIEDLDGHGTHVAGLVGARCDDRGVVGVAPRCRLLIAKVLNNNGYGRSKWVARGIDWAVAQGADIISMSLGSTEPMSSVRQAIRRVPDRIHLVAAAGNSGPRMNTVCWPAKHGCVISVGAIARSRKVTKWSSRGTSVDVVAPGDKVLSCFPKRAFARMSGTSMATPIVAGVMALALAKHRLRGGATPINNRQQMLEHLVKSCVDLGKKGRDPHYGLGLINPNQLLAG